MKKVLTIFTLAIIVLVGSFTTASAASAASKSTTLSSSEPTDTTSRITLGSGKKLYISVANYWYSDEIVKWTIFKNGDAHMTGLTNPNKVSSYTYSASELGTGEYSLRLYCGTYGGLKGCDAEGTLTVK